MSDLFDEAKKAADSHEKQVDQGITKAAEEAEERTGGKYDKQIDEGAPAAERHIGDGDPNN
jgi:hypothetical protein